MTKIVTVPLYVPSLQSIHVMQDPGPVFLKCELNVPIYVLNIGCEIQNCCENFVSFSKVNSYEISFMFQI